VDDGLAVPVAFGARRGAGARTALVLGGGGIVFVSWQIAYLYRLHQLGVDVADADIVVGTSAGSVVASVVTGGHLGRVHTELGLLTRLPALVAAMAPSAGLAPSQRRAAAMFLDAGDSSPATVRAIGHAALAAATPGPGLLPRSLRAVLPSNRWPADGPVPGRLRITATDAYSGERLVLTRAAGVGLRTAAAASSSVPGVFAPQPVADRRAMDGGVSGSGTHADLVAGAGQVLVLSLRGGVAQPTSTQQPGGLATELERLRRSGTVVEQRHTNLPATVNLMDPAAMPAAVAAGRAQAEDDAETLAGMFGG
jgi:NTE family protein